MSRTKHGNTQLPTTPELTGRVDIVRMQWHGDQKSPETRNKAEGDAVHVKAGENDNQKQSPELNSSRFLEEPDEGGRGLVVY